MKLTAKARYGVMAMVDLAAQGVGARASLLDISNRQAISQSYLEQLFLQLRQAGLVTSYRGRDGGYALAMPASEMTLDLIIAALNEDIRAHGCSPETRGACNGQSERCITHDLWGALEEHIGQFLSAISVKDVLDRSFINEQAAQ